MRKTEVLSLSKRFSVKRLEECDVTEVYNLCRENVLYYQYCPPFVTEKSILCDMRALPLDKEMRDKYYVGYYDDTKLIAVMDFIMGFPDRETIYIGFFMTDVSIQNNGVGSQLIEEMIAYLGNTGISKIRLGWVRGNLQAENFWHKNKFVETGEVFTLDTYTVIMAQRYL